MVFFAEHGPGIDIFTPGKPGDYDLEGGIWEDEDARNFYENMVDLKAFVPAILFKDNEKSTQGKDFGKDELKGNIHLFCPLLIFFWVELFNKLFLDVECGIPICLTTKCILQLCS